jgi:hypothetical protein
VPGARPEQRPPDPETSTVDVDGQVHAVRFRGFGEELEIVAPVAARLAPWTLSAHLAALDRDVQARGTGCRLDAQGFCAAVLAGVPEQHHPALQSLALWWASCGGEAPVAEGDAVRCGPVRVRLRPWTLFERSRALSAALRRRDGAREFYPGRYLGEMARASIVEVDPGLPLGELPGAVPLLCAVVDRNLPRPEDDPGDEHLVEVTLRLCQALGWTPERVWSTPAAEVDRLLRLLDAAGRGPTAPRVAAARPRLADDPDATVIRVEED